MEGQKITKVGEALFEALFDGQLREYFLAYYQEIVKKKQQRLEIILEINEEAMPELVAYPWELMSLPQKYNQGEIYFATHRKLSFYRCRYQLEESKKLSIKINQGEQIKIALVVSKPTADSQLSNADSQLSNVEYVEYQEVQQYLKRVDSQQEQVKFLSVMDSLDFYNIVERLEAEKPDIFHFIGHGQLVEKEGEEVGQVAFVNEFGEADWKDARMFGQLFSGHTPKIVILQACETGKQSETNAFSSLASRLMLQGIPIVVAMQYKVSNQTAITFVKEFYSKIIEGDSVEIAVQKARFKLGIENGYERKDFANPVVYMNALDGYLFLKESKDKSSNKQKNSFSNLTDAQKRKLCEKIEEVLKEDSLKNIFIQYRDTFGNNFYNKISGGDYHTRLVNVIEELVNRQLIDDFIKIVRHDYPNFAQDL
ncbi:MAG: CHAT domain-containing protein [Okeania sp. SIO2C2]|uniref:CHAT domain-containing protein n=1 Tax=Okeania sp. SIO2C2 TaxID=2607787 RepID=UPI0013BE1260|nr:CHAT domain-containing protein [Okeania sp. SIO2C2]NEP86972.1 CHAT domain-containing protein [Okeania sp. SIO2C2]